MKLKKENVWDYPRPAIWELYSGKLEVIINNKVLAKTISGIRVIETSHPPTYYFSPNDVNTSILKKNNYHTNCEWKGIANYFDCFINNKIISNIGWFYPNPNPNFLNIRNYIGFYSSKVDICIVNGECAIKQEGDFFGGWITSNLIGPFKGGISTSKW